MEDLYHLLQIPPSASAEDIKRAYRSLAKKLHPDLHPNDPQAASKFKQLNEAYSILGDAEKRRQYDKEHTRQTQPPPRAQQKHQPRSSMSPPDLSNMQQSFSQFFGFDPQTGSIIDEDKLKKKENPLDATGLFEKYMGFK